jgi:hypothetical protein
MIVDSESRKVVTNTNSEVLNTIKTKIKVGFGMCVQCVPKVNAQVTAEIRRYDLHVLGINESRWTDSVRI